MKILWTFEDQGKLDKFSAVLKEHEISFEIDSKNSENRSNQLTISVNDDEYEKSKRLLLRHRKRISST